jgi:hypothetical protein
MASFGRTQPKAIQEQQTAIDSALRQGEINNEIKWIRTLYEFLGESGTDERELPELTFRHLESLSACLVEHIRSRLLPPETAANASRLRAAHDRLWELDAARQRRIEAASDTLRPDPHRHEGLEPQRLALNRRIHVSIGLDGHDVPAVHLHNKSAGRVERGNRGPVAGAVDPRALSAR